MTEPTKEQIEVWHEEATGGTKTLDLPHFAKLAYAAGRKAGMAHALKGCETVERIMPAARGAVAARDCQARIRAAMEPDKP